MFETLKKFCIFCIETFYNIIYYCIVYHVKYNDDVNFLLVEYHDFRSHLDVLIDFIDLHLYLHLHLHLHLQ